jgi:ABC-2 type transport system permease protein
MYGVAALSVGLLASSLSPNQIVAAVVGFGILVILTLSQEAARQVDGVAAAILKELAINSHLEDFLRGVLSTADLAYYVAIAAVFLFLTVRSLESRRWR